MNTHSVFFMENCRKLFFNYHQISTLSVPLDLHSSMQNKLSYIVTKPTKWHVRPAKTQIRPVWSESSLSAWRKIGSLATHWSHSKDSDQTGWMPRLIWVFIGRTCHFVGFITMRLNFPKLTAHYLWLSMSNTTVSWKILTPEKLAVP